jgi:DNA-binding response OmpR family regulator
MSDVIERMPSTDPVFRVAGIEMNLRTNRVRNRDEDVPLTPTEFELLRILMANANRVCSAVLIEHVLYGTQQHRTAALRIGRTIGDLRRKLGDRDRTLIRTAHRIGYRLVGRTA